MGATGLEPATSGVTGRGRVATSVHGVTRKNPSSSDFDEASSARFYELARSCPTVPAPCRPHRPVVSEDNPPSSRSV